MKYRMIKAAMLLLCIIPTSFCSSTSADSQKDFEKAVPIIMYHEVKPHKAGKDVILPWELENDLKYLAENHYTAITMEDLINYVNGFSNLPDKPIILSFDDGYLSNYVYVFPLLKKYQTKIVFSIIAKNTDDFTEIPDSNIDYSHVTWDQLNEMINSDLVEVQNHTYSMHTMNRGRIGCMQKRNEPFSKYEKVLTEDIKKCQDEIIAMTGRTPTTFAYPYGKYSENTDIVLRKLGFKATLTCDYGVNKIRVGDTEALFHLKRICRAHGQSISKILKEGAKTINRSAVLVQ